MWIVYLVLFAIAAGVSYYIYRKHLAVPAAPTPIEVAKPGQNVPSKPGVVLTGIERQSDNYPGVPELPVTPAEARAFGALKVQNLSRYKYLWNLSDADRKAWKLAYLKLCDQGAAGGGHVFTVGLDVYYLSLEDYQTLGILEASNAGGVKFGI